MGIQRKSSTRRRQIKKLAVEFLGSKCQYCGYNKCLRALQFHHVNRKEKNFQIGASGATKNWEKVKDELMKCILLCANCHAEEEEKIFQSTVSLSVERGPRKAESCVQFTDGAPGLL